MRADWCYLPFATWLLLATLALLPFGVAPELPVLAGAVAGTIAIVRGRLDWNLPRVRLALALAFAYWLPECLSAFDSVVPKTSWADAALDLRFLPFLPYIAQNAGTSPTARRALVDGIALIALLWCADALMQAATGFGFGGAVEADRLSGIFGADNLKLGGVMAVLAPFALIAAFRRFGAKGLVPTLLALLVVILLAGARAAWFGFALAAAMSLWHLFGARRALPWLCGLGFATLIATGLGYATSDRFAQRVDRTATALAGDHEALDHALSGRLAIWETAWRMGEAHPVNGVGVRAFRHAYPDFAAPDDPFLDADGEQGALHAHQLVLELWSETGLIGLFCWIAAVLVAWRTWRRLPAESRRPATPAAIALIVALFPINTHYAMYSAFWGLLLMWMMGVWLALCASDTTRP